MLSGYLVPAGWSRLVAVATFADDEDGPNAGCLQRHYDALEFDLDRQLVRTQ